MPANKYLLSVIVNAVGPLLAFIWPVLSCGFTLQSTWDIMIVVITIWREFPYCVDCYKTEYSIDTVGYYYAILWYS